MANIINRQQTFLTNGTVTAAGLHNLIDTALVNSAIIKNQQEITTIGTADLLLVAPDSVDASLAPRKVTVQNLFDDGLTAGTFTSLNLTGALTYGTATGNRTVSTSATITTGTIPSLTAGTTTSTAANITNGTIQTLTASTSLISQGSAILTQGTIATLNSTTGTIGNLSTTLAGDLTISQGTATLSTTGATAATYGTTSLIPVITVDAKGRTTSATSVTNPVGFRNRIINGDMSVFQRATNGTTLNTTAYVVDRMWMFSGAGVAATGSQVTSTGLSGFPNAMRTQRNSGNTGTAGLYAGQIIETSNCQDLAGQTVSISFWARAGANYSATSSALTVGAFTGSGTDQGLASAIASTWTGYAASTIGTATLTTSWQKFTFTFSVPAGTNEIGLYAIESPTGTAGANDYFDVTGLQLELGSTATDFERRPIGTELALCQRYYFQPTGTWVVTTAAVAVPNNFPTTMRVAPTASGGGAGYSFVGGTTNIYESQTSRANATMKYTAEL